MVRFSLPKTSTEQPVAFRDAFLASQWLAKQPQANVPVMLEALTREIDAFNHFALPTRERFKTLEALRRMVFTIGSESCRHFENKPLPLTADEQAVFLATSRLWRCCTLGYLYCLNACLEGEASLNGLAGKIAHRAITSLRMEQLCCYGASSALGDHFWKELHAIYLAAEKLQVLSEFVRDPLPNETLESTLTGQYGMAILTHLADPYTLRHVHLLAILQWLSRWRELVTVQTPADTSFNNNAHSVVLDLSFPQDPAHSNKDSATQRQISFDAIFRKIGKRIKALKGGASPEDLRLGKLVTSEVSIDLLGKLGACLYAPVLTPSRAATAMQPVEVLCTLTDIYRFIGGTSTQENQPETSVARIKAERLAIFGHIADPGNLASIVFETWQGALSADTTTTLNLQRAVNRPGKRLACGDLLGIRQTPDAELQLASVSRLFTQDGQIMVGAHFLAGKISPLAVEITEKISNATFRYPALLLTGSGNESQIILPTNALARVLRCRLYNGADSALLPLPFTPQSLIERHGDNERWQLGAPDAN